MLYVPGAGIQDRQGASWLKPLVAWHSELMDVSVLPEEGAEIRVCLTCSRMQGGDEDPPGAAIPLPTLSDGNKALAKLRFIPRQGI